MISCGMVFIVGWATALSLPNIPPSDNNVGSQIQKPLASQNIIKSGIKSMPDLCGWRRQVVTHKFN